MLSSRFDTQGRTLRVRCISIQVGLLSDPELTIHSILGDDGSIAARLSNYEPRPQQLRMAEEVGDALDSQEHLIAEAGTGTGKSFAYLVPAILHATGNTMIEQEGRPPRRPRVLISTHTISLQEQLISKDIPLLNSVIPREFSSVLVKGRSNYLSIRRMERAFGKMTTMFGSDLQYQQLRRIKKWTAETSDGSLATLPVKPRCGSLG